MKRTAVFALVSRLVLTIVVATTSFVIGRAQGQPEFLWQSGGHYRGIPGVAYTADGSKLVTGGGDATVKIWDAQTLSLIKTLGGFPDIEQILAVAVSPDSHTVASRNYSGRVTIWDIESGAITRQIDGGTPTFGPSVAFSPDGQTLAAPGDLNGVIQTNVATGEVVHTFLGHTEPITSVAFSPDGKILASGSMDHTCKFWNIQTGAFIRTLSAHADDITAIAFSPDAKIFATGSKDGRIKFWDVATGRQFRTISNAPHESISFSPNGKILAASSIGLCKLYDVQTGTVIRTLPSEAKSIAFNPGGTEIALAYSRLIVSDVNTGNILRQAPGHVDRVTDIAFPDAETVASAAYDGTVKLWDANSGDLTKDIVVDTDPYPYGFGSVQFGPGGYAFIYSRDYNSVWDTLTGTERGWYFGYFQTRACAISADGLTYAEGALELNEVIVGDFQTHHVRKFAGHSSYISKIFFSLDGLSLATGSEDKTVKIWNVSTGEVRRTISYSFGPTYLIAFSPDGTTVVTTSDRFIYDFWDVQTGERKYSLSGDQWNNVNVKVAFSPDGQTVATAWTSDKKLKITNRSTGVVLRAYDLDVGSGVRAIAYSQDGALIGIGRDDATFGVCGNPFARVVSGHVNLLDWRASAHKIPVEVAIFPVAGTVPLQTTTTILDKSGKYSVAMSLGPGTYDISIKAPNWLRGRICGVPLGETGATGLDISLVNGDCNGDNYIGTDDYILFSIAYGTVLGDIAYDYRADLNGDGTVGTDDYLILSSHFDESGD